MTYRQFGTLRYIDKHDINLDYVRMFNLTTFGSLLHKGWAQKSGTKITLTKSGLAALEQYNKATVVTRKHAGDVSARVALMLNLRLNGAGK